MAGISIKGTKEAKAALRALTKEFPEQTAAALYIEGQSVLAKSQRLVPVEFGRLRATGIVAPPENRKGKPFVTVGYGTEYAIYVHEKKAKHKPPTQWKYLTTALDDVAKGYIERLAKRIKELVASGRKFGG